MKEKTQWVYSYIFNVVPGFCNSKDSIILRQCSYKDKERDNCFLEAFRAPNIINVPSNIPRDLRTSTKQYLKANVNKKNSGTLKSK